MWFLLLIKYYKKVSKIVSALATNVLAANILDFKLVSKRLIKTNIEHSYLVANT